MVLTANELDTEMFTGYEDQGSTEESMDASLLHEQLVRHVLVVSGELDTRLDVWGEHSYARARGAAANTQIRVLLAPTASVAPSAEDDELLDVETAPRPLPAPPCDHLDADPHTDDPADDDDGDEADGWEERLVALAPSAAHARLATAALAALRDLRLERLASGGGRWVRSEGAAAAARRLRRALAPHWAGGAGGGGAAWLHAALTGLPGVLAPLYAEVLGELRRQVPRLVERMGAGGAVARDPLAAEGAARAAGAPGPWLAWAPGGCAAEDARWLRRLGALVHARALCPPPASRAPTSPERWCASLAQEARAALVDMMADAGRRAVVVGGAGSGAALATWLAAGAGAARVRGLLLLAPPLLTAEGPRDAPEDALRDVDVPLLAVVGGGAAQCWRGAAAALAGVGSAAGVGAARRRVLVVAGADDALRLPRALRRRRHLPQHALDAALAEECARWAVEAAETPDTPRDRSSRRRAAAPPETEEGRPPTTGGRSIEIIEGRVVSRGPAGAPLALLPPRLAAADIMQLPIVFADDEPPPPAAPAPAPAASPAAALESDAVLTVRSGRGGVGGRGGGELRYTRVLVAKRGAGGGGGGGGGRAPATRRRALHDGHEPRP